MWYVYVLSCEGEIYIGFTNDVDRRLEQHNSGKNSSTKGKLWKLAYFEAYASENDARQRERSLKSHGQSMRWLKERIVESLQIS